MKAAKQWLLLFTLSSSLVAGACAYAADSTGLSNSLPAATGGSGVNSYYPDQATVPSVTSGSAGSAYYDSLPNCPGDPTAPAAAPAPICPDINDIWRTSPTTGVPAGTSASGNVPSTQALKKFCPDVCQTNRLTVDGTPVTTSSGTTYTPVVSMTPAVCPAGYVQISATTPAADVQYSPSPGSAVQATDIVQYQSYVSKGYTCTTKPGSTLATTHCDYNGSYAFTNTESNNCSASDIGKPVTYTIGSSIQFGILTTCPTYTAANISAGSVACKLQGVSKCGLSGPTKSDGLCQDYHATLFLNTYTPIYCSAPAGYYYTTDTVPTKLVCARVKSVWQKRY